MAWQYQPDQLLALSPATRRIALRHGSKTNKIRTSVEPADPGESSLRLWMAEPLIRSTNGWPRFGPTSASALIAYDLSVAAVVDRCQVVEPSVDLVSEEDLPRHPVARYAKSIAHAIPAGHDRPKLAGDNPARRTTGCTASDLDPNPLVALQLYSGHRLRRDGFQLHPVLDFDVDNA
jgi:hypothetical protein